MSTNLDGVQFPEKTIRVLPFDMLRIASGHPMAFKTSDGEDVTIQLYTADEFRAEQTAVAVATGVEPVAAGRAEELTKPLTIST